MELNGIYNQSVLKDMREIIELYEIYDKKGQDWVITEGLDYEPTKLITNKVKNLIKEEARFMFSRTPEISVKAVDKKDNEEAEKTLNNLIRRILKKNQFSNKLIMAARDCFIGKRIALKLHADDDNLKIIFKPSLEFIYETDPDDIDELIKIIFFYNQNNEADKSKQRIWRQKYELINGKCILNEGVFNGYGALIESKYQDHDTKLDFIPARVIVNDGLTGDLNGESDVNEIKSNQDVYNKLKSDDIDAMKFNMFPERVAINADKNSMDGLKVAPGALIDLQPEETDLAADYKKVESNFSYDSKFENTINRVNNDMYDLLKIPNIGLEQLKGLMQSGKSMKALYWGLITRCEEKWCVWEPALEWMAEKIIELYKLYKPSNFKGVEVKDFDYNIHIEHLYPILEDEETERINDMAEVAGEVRSRKSYIEKWKIAEDPEEEIKQIAAEKKLLEDAFNGAVGAEIDEE